VRQPKDEPDPLPFGRQPFDHLQRLSSVFRTGDPRVWRRVALVILIGWVPLAVLVVVGSLVRGDPSARSFGADYATQARFLVAAPLFIVAERFCLPRLAGCVRGFWQGGLIGAADGERFRAAAAALGRSSRPAAAEAAIVLLAYLLVVLGYRYGAPQIVPYWRAPEGRGSAANSLALGWLLLVSHPLLFVLLLAWGWRQLRWAQFLWRTSQLDLQLVPSHPDLMGGLNFVTTTLRGYAPLGMAMASMMAGAMAIRVVHGGASLALLPYAVPGVLAIALCLFAGPLVVFRRNLLAARERGKLDYGALAGRLGLQFERKWLRRPEVEESALEMPDFSATTDLYQVAGNVYQMKHLPLGIKDVGPLVLATLLPFIPVALAAVPSEQVVGFLKHVAGLLL
jgi:hypothetical protein